MPIKRVAVDYNTLVKTVHDACTEFGNRCYAAWQALENSTGDYREVANLPTAAIRATDARSFYDSQSVPGSEAKRIADGLYGYSDFPAEIADFNAIFTKADQIRIQVDTGYDSGLLPPTLNDANGRPEYTSVDATFRTELIAALNDTTGIMQHFDE